MEYFWDALLDTGKLLPILLAVYFGVALLEYRYGDRMGTFLARTGILGPVAGAILGCIPQCGFSVIAAALYVKRLISAGTLLAVFLSTSDEAIPVLLSWPGQIETVSTLMILKILIAILAGISVDMVISLSRRALPVKPSVTAAPEEERHCHAGCCAHDVAGGRSRRDMLFLHPLRHTLRIGLFLFVLTFLLNVVIALIGENRLSGLMMAGTLFQPFITSLVGLIPNCFASVFLADLFAHGTISFGALVSGLCAGAGLGILVLIRENKDHKDTVSIFATLLAVSYVAGAIIQIFL